MNSTSVRYILKGEFIFTKTNLSKRAIQLKKWTLCRRWKYTSTSFGIISSNFVCTYANIQTVTKSSIHMTFSIFNRIPSNSYWSRFARFSLIPPRRHVSWPFVPLHFIRLNAFITLRAKQVSFLCSSIVFYKLQFSWNAYTFHQLLLLQAIAASFDFRTYGI